MCTQVHEHGKLCAPSVSYETVSHEGMLIFHALRLLLIVLLPPVPSRDWKGGPVTLSGIDYLSGPRPFRLFLPTVNANLVLVISHSDGEFSFASGRQPYRKNWSIFNFSVDIIC